MLEAENPAGFEEKVCSGESVLLEAEVQALFKNRERVAQFIGLPQTFKTGLQGKTVLI